MQIPGVPVRTSRRPCPHRRVRPWATFTGLFVSLFLFASGNLCAQDDSLGLAARDLEAGNARAAYERLAPARFERAGEPDYDYLLGLSALGTGRGTEAVFALERVLALRPKDTRVRTAMGRAHLALRETEAARREFQTAQAQAGSADTKRAIERYLTAVDQIEAAAKFSARLFVEFGVGYDSNVNSATTATQVAVPALGGLNFVLSSSSRKQSDGFLSAAGGLQFRSRVSPSTSLFGGLSFGTRLYFVETTYEPSSLDASLGLARSRGANTLSAALQLSSFHVNDPSYSGNYRESVGTTLQWLRNFEGAGQTSLYVQYALLTHPDQDPRDAHRYVLGGAYGKGFQNGASAYLGAYLGIEKERKANYAYLAHVPAGLRAGGDWPFGNRWGLFANGSFEHRRYREADPLFMVVRKDKQYATAMGFNYELEKGWRLSPQVSYTRAYSTIDINAYDRWQAQIVLRGEF